MNFWEWLVHVGLIEADPAYYTTEADQPAIEHALRTAMASLETAPDPTAKTEFYRRLQEAGGLGASDRISYYAEGEADQAALENLVSVAAGRLLGGTTSPAAGGGATGQPVLAGGQTIRVTGGDGQIRFYQVYEFPAGSGNFVSYQFNNEAQATVALGQNFGFTPRDEAWYNQYVLAEASAEEVIGLKGTWQGFTREIMTDAAAAAGIRDPSLAGRMASDPEMQQIMAQALLGDWTPEQIRAEQRRTTFWKEVLYPGIETFYGRTDSPERAWVEYQNAVAPALAELGYQRDADGTYNTQMKRMLDNKIDAQTFLNQVPTFIQATQNVEFAGILNQWATQELGRAVTFNDWFDLMAGESAPELDAVAEKAQLAFESQRRGLGLTDQQVGMLAGETQMSAAEMQRSFSEFAQGILATGEAGLARYGLSENDVLRASVGLGSGDRSADEIRLSMAKIAREEALFDDEKINFYMGFSAAGTPNRPGLQSLAPER